MSNNYKVAIYGNGKVALWVIENLVRSGVYMYSDFIVIKRKSSQRSMPFLSKKKITVSSRVQGLRNAKHVVLCVSSAGSGEMLRRLRAVAFPAMPDREIISFVPGLTEFDICKSISGINKVSIATGNPALENYKGIIFSTRNSSLLDVLGVPILKKESEQVLSSSYIVEKMNILSLHAIMFAQLQHEQISFPDWCNGLQKKLSRVTYRKKIPHEYKIVFKYISVITSILVEPPFFYRYPDARKCIFKILKNALIVFQTNSIPFEGSLNSFTVEQLHSKSYLEQSIFVPAAIAASKSVLQVAESLLHVLAA